MKIKRKLYAFTLTETLVSTVILTLFSGFILLFFLKINNYSKAEDKFIVLNKLNKIIRIEKEKKQFNPSVITLLNGQVNINYFEINKKYLLLELIYVSKLGEEIVLKKVIRNAISDYEIQ